MAKQITKDQIAERGVLDNLLKPLEDFNKLLKNTDELLKNFSKNAKSQLAFKTDSKGMREQETLQRKINSAYQQKIRIDKEEAKIEREKQAALNRARKEKEAQWRAEESLQKQRERGLKQMERERKQAEELNRPYNRLSRSLNDLRKEYRDLSVSGQENTKRARELKVQIDALDKTLKKVDGDMGVFGRNVGNYTGAIQKGFKSAIGLAQQFGLALGGIALARGAINTIVEFDSSLADLSAITGATGDQLDFFRKNAIKLGSDVKGGAAAVVEGYKLIASAKPELLDNAAALNQVTAAAITLAKASGMELPDAATALTDAMNQFGASADQADKYINVLAAGAKFGAAEIPQITDALLKFGAVAKSTNVSIEESTALIELLAERGIKGADAGTALRNVMLKLSAPDALPKEAQERLKALGINFDTLKDRSLTFSQRLQTLKPLLKDNAALIKTFGLENEVAAQVLIESTTRVDDLNESIHGPEGLTAAQDAAATRSKTLSEAFIRLQNAWDNAVLSFSEGGTSGVTDFIDYLAKNLPEIITLVAKLGATFLIFKGVMASLKLADRVKDFIALRKVVAEGNTEMKNGASAAKSFGQSLKGIGFTAVIALAAQLAYELYDIASGARQAALDIKRLDTAKTSGGKAAGDNIAAEQKKRDDAILKAQDLKNKGKITELELTKRVAKANADYEKSIQQLSDISSKKQKENFKQYQEAAKALEDYRKEVGDVKFETLRTIGASLREGGATGAAVAGVSNGTLNQQAILLDELIQRLSVLKAQQGGLTERNNAYRLELDALNKATIEAAATTDDLGAAYDENKEKIEDYTMRVRELQEARIKDAQSRDEAQLKTQLDADLAAIKSNGIKANELRIELEKTYQADILRLQKEYNTKRLEAEYEYWDAVKEAQNQAKDDYESEQDAAYNQEIKSVTDRDKRIELQILKSNMLEEAADLKRLKRKEESLKQQIEIAQYYGKETIDLELELARTRGDIIKKQQENEKKDAEELAKFKNSLIREGTEYLSKQIDKQIEMLDKRKQKAAELENFLQEAAAQGNIKAEQSIVEQQRIQEEADRKRADLERMKARIVALGAILQTYNNKTAAGDKNALADTIVESGALLTFLDGLNLPGFYSGTETTLGDAMKATKPGKDGHLIWADSDERILNPALSNRIPKNMTNEAVVDVVEKYATGNMVYRDQYQGAYAGTSFDISPLLAKHDELIHEIKAIPNKDLDIEKLAEGLFMLTATKQTMNLTKKSQFIIKK